MLTPSLQQPFPFRKLPAELRNKLYHFAFEARHYPVDVYPSGTAQDRSATKRHQLSHGLLRVSRQIYHEALPFCYRNIQFYFENLSMLLSFFKKIGPIARANLITIQVKYFVGYSESGPVADAFAAAGLCENLTSLTVQIWLSRSTDDSLDFACLDHIKRLNDVRQARGSKEVRADQILYDPEPSDFFRCWSTRDLQLMREAWGHMIIP